MNSSPSTFEVACSASRTGAPLVNWGVDVPGAEPSPGGDQFVALCHSLARDEVRVGTTIEQLIPPSQDGTANDIRTSSHGFRYPALAVPLGPDDRLVCPDNQQEHIRSRLDQQHVGYGLNVLIIGYSCLDKQPLELIKNSGNRIESLVIVNGEEGWGQNAYEEVLAYLTSAAPQRRIESDIVEIFDGGFTEFTKSEQLPALVARLTI